MDTTFAFRCTTSLLSGGLDIKAGGIMAGMHRDKCGAAAVAGVMAALAITQASFPHSDTRCCIGLALVLFR